MTTLLDTNAYRALMEGHAGVAGLFRRSRRCCLSSIVLGELLFGFHNGTRLERNLDQLEEFLGNARVHLLPVTRVTADRYARIATGLRRKGRPIPSNDIWIAAHALETGADLVSFDEHFGAVDGLVWVQPAP